jgi:hypothetical protein
VDRVGLNVAVPAAGRLVVGVFDHHPQPHVTVTVARRRAGRAHVIGVHDVAHQFEAESWGRRLELAQQPDAAFFDGLLHVLGVHAHFFVNCPSL